MVGHLFPEGNYESSGREGALNSLSIWLCDWGQKLGFQKYPNISHFSNVVITFVRMGGWVGAWVVIKWVLRFCFFVKYFYKQDLLILYTMPKLIQLVNQKLRKNLLFL